MSINYNFKTNIPQYEPKNKPVKLTDCIDVIKYRELKKKILNSNVSKLEKQFLLACATRHYVFNYSNNASISPFVIVVMEVARVPNCCHE